ncbi:MAG: hypothetical protein WDW38_008226 [Sanguina aurantia]
MPSLCATTSLGTAQCEQVACGQWNLTILDYSCCSHGFSPVAYLSDGNECGCDDKQLLSSYALAQAGLSYDNVANVTSVTFHLNHNSDLSDQTSSCRGTDVKTVLIVMSHVYDIITLDTSEFSLYDLLPTGIVMAYGTSGSDFSECKKVGVSRSCLLAQLCPGNPASSEGCPYQLCPPGGYSFNFPF